MLQFLIMLLGLVFPSDHNIATTSTDETPIYSQFETEQGGNEDDLGGEHGQAPPKK